MADPVFVLGAARSGTSAVSQALLKTRYTGFNEGHIIGLLTTINDQISSYFERYKNVPDSKVILVKNTSKSEVIFEYNQAFKKIFENLHDNYEYILDKTPTIIGLSAIPHLLDIWPDAKIIYCQRRGLEVVRSALIKWPNAGIENRGPAWADMVEMWQNKMADLAGNFLMIEHIELTYSPDKVSRALQEFLNLEPEEGAILSAEFADRRFEVTSETYHPVDEADLPWSPEDREIFDQICAKSMLAGGYSYDPGYFLPGPRRDEIMDLIGLPRSTKISTEMSNKP